MTPYENIKQGEVHLLDLHEAAFRVESAEDSAAVSSMGLLMCSIMMFIDPQSLASPGGTDAIPSQPASQRLHQSEQGWQPELQPALTHVAHLYPACGTGTSRLLVAIAPCCPHHPHGLSCCNVHMLVPAFHAEHNWLGETFNPICSLLRHLNVHLHQACAGVASAVSRL